MAFQMPDIDIGIPDISINPPPITIGGGGSGSARARAVAIVNAYEIRFRENYDQYRAGNISASRAAQNFDQLWNEMVSQLGQLGSEGQRAIADRSAGGRFDWFAAYRPAGARSTPPPASPGLPGLPVAPAEADWTRMALLAGGAFVAWKLLR